jgi:REP element-mobilizing transposase RayT
MSRTQNRVAMIIAYHVILSAYGFWLPNDPRGSWSVFCAAWELFRYGGKATKVETTESVAHVAHDRAKRLATKRRLKYPPVRWNGLQARGIARGFAQAIGESRYNVLACAILEDHAHLVMTRTDRPLGQVVGHLKARATQQLREEGIHPFEPFADPNGAVPTMWAGKYWKVFIDNEAHFDAAIAYVDDNPIKERKKRQEWVFVEEARERVGYARRKRRG